MECPQCHFTNPPGSTRCVKCSTDFGTSGDSPPRGAAKMPPIPSATEAGATSELTVLHPALKPGSVFGGRYEILELLGQGGMGAVFKAKDRELDRLVALKVIRPELANRPEILRRFKQELILARKVSHKNVVRIFDLGDTEGIKFISMDYVDGRGLKTLLKYRRKFPPNEAASIISQICLALDAAHTEGVIHRDLKPQNVLMDGHGRVTVMDFGIARSTETPGLTQTGLLLGTPEYMSPEQAKGEEVDARSDLFALGIVFYELLTGKVPFRADTALGTLLKRTQERARPPIESDPSIPRAISDVVVRCLEIDPRNRYQSAMEVFQDLQGEQAARGVRPRSRVLVRPFRARAFWKWLAAVLAGLAVIAILVLLREKVLVKPSVAQKTVTLLVADFANETADPVFDGTLEPMLGIALEGASFITSFNRGTAMKVASRLQGGATRLDESLAQLVARREGVDVIVSGAISRPASDYVVSVKAMDAGTGKPILAEKATARNKNDVLSTIGQLAAHIRRALGDVTPESAQLAAAETFTASSLEAAHEYALAQDFQWAGKYDEAIQHYSKAAEFDPNLGRAYSGMAAVSYNVGRRQDAEKYYKLALSRLDRMSDREKYRTRSGYYLMVGNAGKAVEELNQFTEQYPSDTAGTANLAFAYFLGRNLPKALEVGRRAVELSPKNVIQRNNLGLYAMYAGDFDAAIREQQKVLDLNPAFVLGHLGMALSQLAEGKTAEASQSYERLAKVSAQGASVASIGLADLALYEGRANDAVRVLQKGIAEDFQHKDPDAAARKLALLAEAQSALRRPAEARTAADKAVAASSETGVLFWAARVYVATGAESKAQALADKLLSRLEADPKAYAKLIQGEAGLKHGMAGGALSPFQEAQRLADTWLGHLDMGRAYFEAGAFTEAYSEFDACLKRRGEATAAFLDEVPTLRVFPEVYYYLGRAQEGLKSPAAAESYKTFLAIKAKGGEGPLVADARRRIESH